MKNFLVKVEYNFDVSYLKTMEYRVQGSSFPVAVAKALRLFRKDVKGRRVKTGRIIFTQYATAI